MSCLDGSDATLTVKPSQIRRVLGWQVSAFIDDIAQEADKSGLTLYLVGGVVRDFMLSKRNIDLDFVLEGDAIAFAQRLARLRGGALQIHRAFGTAKWKLDEAAAGRLSLALDQLPAQVDFATARSETYAHPTALPAVAPCDIRRDLDRRDFTINALALQLSPRERAGEVIDVAGGRADIEQKRVRVLHEGSFVDDPTRIFRAQRYALRYGFDIEVQTAAWMREALPLLGRMTGQRLQNEIDLILRERESGRILLRLHQLGALRRIHRAFVVSAQLPDLLTRCDRLIPPWEAERLDKQTLRWNLLLASMEPADARAICERLALTKTLTQSAIASATLASRLGMLDDPSQRPSQVAQLLDKLPESALLVGWLLAAEKPRALANIRAYASDWRHRRATISGADLKAMGIKPGPIYRRILDELRFFWIDNEIQSIGDEKARLLEILTAEGCASFSADVSGRRDGDSS